MSDVIHVFDFGPWAVESLRLTVFHASSPPNPGLWQKVMGISPEQVESRPRQNVITEHGDLHGNQLRLIIQADRLDWNVVAGPVTDIESTTPPRLTSLEQTVSVLVQALDVSISEVGQVDRLAFAPVLVQQATNQSEAMSQLSTYLPQLDLLNRGGSDFMYQINRRRRSSSAPHVVINRLAKWQVDHYQSGAIRISPSLGPQLETSAWELMIKLLLDINTAPENNAISSARMPTLFAEFTNLAYEVASEGDVL